MSLRDDLLALTALITKVAGTEDPGAFASLLAAAQKDPAIATAVRATAVEPRRRDCRDVIQRAIGRGELHDPRLATVLFETAIGQMMVRFLLQSDGFDDAEQIDFVDHTLIPALKAHDKETYHDADR
ncbi:TetR-like C-terminal domain-containing protein [Mycobacterium colombiense]